MFEALEPRLPLAGELFFDSGQSLGHASSADVALGDIDGDGDLDAVVANRDSANTVWLNRAGVFIAGTMFGGPSEGIALADVDGDQDLDVYEVRGGWGNVPNRVWFNDGWGNFGDSGQLLGNLRSHAIAMADLDGDGDPDAVEANFANQPNTVWINDGHGFFIDSGQNLGLQNSHDVALADLDGDEDIDVFIASGSPTPNKVWLNDGNGVFIETGQEIGSEFSFGVALGDLNGDNHVDAFIANTWPSNNAWFNSGHANFTSGQALGNSWSVGVALGDLDLDNDLDAFVANGQNQPNRVWLNDSRGGFLDSQLALGQASSSDVALGDIDGDGDLDAFVANDGANKVWVNQTRMASTPGTVEGLVWEDVDRDGIRNVTESLFAGVAVQLLGVGADGQPNGGDDSLIGSVMTNAEGAYRFEGVNLGQYYVSVSAPEGFGFSPAGQGNVGSLDSDVAPENGRTDVLWLAPGQVAVFDAGLHNLVPFPFHIDGKQFIHNGQPAFLNIVSYSPLEPGQGVFDEIREARVLDDLRRLRDFVRGDGPLLLRVYPQPTGDHPLRLPQSFYDGVRELDMWIIRDVFFDGFYQATDAADKGKAAIDAVIAEAESAGALDRIFAWEIGNEFLALPGDQAPADQREAFTPEQADQLHGFLNAMRDHLKSRMSVGGRGGYSNLFTWTASPNYDPLFSDLNGVPMVVDAVDYWSFNVYPYWPAAQRDQRPGRVTGTPFAGYIESLIDRLGELYGNKPLVISETGLADSGTALDEFRLHPWYPVMRYGGLSSEQVAEGLADRFWDARLNPDISGFSAFEWADEWWKTGDDSTHDNHPEEYYGLIRYERNGGAYEARNKLQLDTVRDLLSLNFRPASDVITGITADNASVLAGESTIVRVVFPDGAPSPMRIRWESSRGRVVGEGDTVVFYAGPQALGPALVTAVGIDVNGNATRQSVVIDIQPLAQPMLEILTLGTSTGFASGRIENVDLDDHKLIAYVITDRLYQQPFQPTATTPEMTDVFVRADGYWQTRIHNSLYNSAWGGLQVWAVPRSFDAPLIANLGYVPPNVAVGVTLATANDSDNDLLPDTFEQQHFGTLEEDRYGDPDQDLANNIEEFLAGQRPTVADNDSDFDGLADNYEWLFFASLAYAGGDDPDSDGILNSDEQSRGLHPGRHAVDADGDGLPDRWEQEWLFTQAVGASDDLNRDGFTALDAYELSKSPIDARLPWITVIADQTTGSGRATGPVRFLVGDLVTAADNLSLTANSSNSALVPDDAITLSGSGASRTITISPIVGEVGSSTITITVTDADGEAVAEAFELTVTPDEPHLRVRLDAVDVTGTPVTAVRKGARFILRAHVTDLRRSPLGVFAAYTDVTYDASLTVVADAIRHGDQFGEGAAGDTSNPGLIDEVGSFTGIATPLGAGEVLLFSVPFRATGIGLVEFSLDAADISPEHDLLLFNSPTAVSSSRVEFLGTAVEVIGNIWNNGYDVNGDSAISPVDVLLVVIELNHRTYSESSGQLPLAPAPPLAPPPYLDVNGDGYASPADALAVINLLNARRTGGEGEHAGRPSILDFDKPIPMALSAATDTVIARLAAPWTCEDESEVDDHPLEFWSRFESSHHEIRMYRQ